ncbi:hypothetical protein PF002_g10366 [Phytophthora fragariae]|uniref:Uncharacterized protein n=1 Tax=Phytophthora fragariae TaxID=53985 RepID=A0A6A3T6P1_9STRA|nr:hypothetical protein PF011_g6634 [Phytophthora fragariae]KAE9127959.1 hypothetical protein PF006_g16398 [Phytophthora fragariae]KAE9239235.1 hypothetical protein PF002_g10366 [Phytophthora fragariae]
MSDESDAQSHIEFAEGSHLAARDIEAWHYRIKQTVPAACLGRE